MKNPFVSSVVSVVPCKTVKGVHYNKIELVIIAVRKHFLKAGAKVIFGSFGSIDIFFDYEQIIVFCILMTNAELPFNGLLCLFCARKASVNNRFSNGSHYTSCGTRTYPLTRFVANVVVEKVGNSKLVACSFHRAKEIDEPPV